MKKTKKSSLYTPVLWTLLAAFLAVLIYGLVRFFLLRGTEGDLGALLKMLFETVPALVVLLTLGISALITLKVGVAGPVGKMTASVSGVTKRLQNGETPASVPANGCLSSLSETLTKEEGALAQLMEETAKASDGQATAREQLDAARKICAFAVPKALSYGGMSYGVCARTDLAPSVGADLTDSFALDKRRIFFAIGDVWGKGLSAAFFLTRLKFVLREQISCGRSPAEALAAANAALLRDNRDTLAATVFCALFDPESGELRFANAGHLPPVITGETPGFLRMRAGAPLGLYEDARFEDEVFALHPGQGLFLYTDGVVNCSDGKELFGYDRLLSSLKALLGSALSADTVTEGIMGAVNEFRASEEDDASALTLYYPVGVQRLLRPELGDIEPLREFLSEWLGEDPRKKNILLACEEIFTNIVNHAGAKAIQIGCEREESSIIIRFTDDGEPFNPLQAESGEKELYAYAEGGMGMTIIRRIAGEIFYRTKQNLNVLTVRFPVIRGM